MTVPRCRQKDHSLDPLSDDTWINPMPMFHTAGCGLATLGALQTGGTQVLPPGFDPELALHQRHRKRLD
jgi:acyl-CoA synthetase (AMP-forming)/AMP-acid ligase II